MSADVGPGSSALRLTSDERADLRRRFDARLISVEARTADLFAFRPVPRPVIITTGAWYFLFGRSPATIPEGIFSDPALMTDDQERIQYEQLCLVDDDYMPYVMPWHGTAVTASALGSRIVYPPGQDPAVDPTCYPIVTAEDIRRLEVPAAGTAGLMPTVLESLRYMTANSALPVCITDCQGPLTTANQLMGYDKLIYLMVDEPAAAHELMDKVTTTLIDWFRLQKELIGERPGYCFSDQLVYTGPHVGIWFSDDDAVLMSADLYREFVVPYNSRFLRAFGGGMLHYCGNGNHQVDNLLATDGLLGLTVFPLHDLRSIAELQRRVFGRLVLFIGDFTPADHRPWLDGLFEAIDPRGVAVLSMYSPVLGLLEDGRYRAVSRPAEGVRDVHRHALAAADARWLHGA
jgi:uroporphyrinogen-III decarboxylase